MNQLGYVVGLMTVRDAVFTPSSGVVHDSSAFTAVVCAVAIGWVVTMVALLLWAVSAVVTEMSCAVNTLHTATRLSGAWQLKARAADPSLLHVLPIQLVMRRASCVAGASLTAAAVDYDPAAASQHRAVQSVRVRRHMVWYQPALLGQGALRGDRFRPCCPSGVRQRSCRRCDVARVLLCTVGPLTSAVVWCDVLWRGVVRCGAMWCDVV